MFHLLCSFKNFLLWCTPPLRLLVLHFLLSHLFTFGNLNQMLNTLIVVSITVPLSSLCLRSQHTCFVHYISSLRQSEEKNLFDYSLLRDTTVQNESRPFTFLPPHIMQTLAVYLHKCFCLCSTTLNSPHWTTSVNERVGLQLSC